MTDPSGQHPASVSGQTRPTPLEMVQYLCQSRLVAVLRRLPDATLDAVVQALVQGGVKCIEITMDQPGAEESIARLRAGLPAGVWVGAGTVMTAGQVDAAITAGADLLVSPHLDTGLVAHAFARGVLFVPGVMTPTEMATALAAGALLVKVFPAGSLSSSYVREVLRPFAQARIMVTGGVTEDNVEDFLRAGAQVVGMGSALVHRAEVERGDWTSLTRRARRLQDRLHSVRTSGAN